MRLSKVFSLALGCALFFGGSMAFGELIVNGDFELGGVAFKSDYMFDTSNGLNGEDEGQFSVNAAPQLWNMNFTNPGPAGNSMLVVNGSSDSWNRVWSQKISVEAGVQYDVSFDAASLFPDNPANLAFYVGTDPGNPFALQQVTTLQLDGTVGDGAWTSTLPAMFIASMTGEVAVFITDLNQMVHGNDFAIDNISVVDMGIPVPEPSSLALLGIGSMFGLAVYSRRRRSKA